MLRSLKKLFENSEVSNALDSNNDLVVLVGLMIEAANTDGNISQEELDKISYSLINTFNEDQAVVENILNNSLQNKDSSRSLHYYTSKINKIFSDDKKLLLIETLWEIILSDNKIHDFESSLIRRLAGLLYISDVNCGNAKIRAQRKLQSRDNK
ncbi:MAG: hypothetical protein CFH15_00670 [Alphaproteobacteria bacterium MarineAlpha5_Bin5]|nr:MAG: hypothetical protein CFH14_01185 [Alphaproteobacteria bacterium MarineAlpha5_Bin4]PPR50157.1 MAG: hypothetical protein CFH15_00670 [Alphaproteobacteria bacterium MarineAlpha5_Bin5]